MFSGTAQVFHQVFFVSSVCLLLRVTMVDENKGVVCCSLAVGELGSSLCERRLERTVLKPAVLPVKTVQFTQFFRQVRSHTVK